MARRARASWATRFVHALSDALRSLDQRSDQRVLVALVQLDGAPIVVTARQIASLKSMMLTSGFDRSTPSRVGEGNHGGGACSPPNGDDSVGA
jgi:hypothetical protein